MTRLTRVEKFKKYRADIAKKNPVKLVTSEIEKQRPQSQDLVEQSPKVVGVTSMHILSMVVSLVLGLGLLIFLALLWLGGQS